MKIDLNINDINIEVYFLKILVISMGTYLFNTKILKKEFKTKKILKSLIAIVISSFLVMEIRYKTNTITSIIFLVFLLSIVYSEIENIEVSYSILINSISLSINYILFATATTVTYLINIFINDNINDFLNLVIIIINYIIFLISILKIKRIKNGIAFLNIYINRNNIYFSLLIFNLSICILFFIAILSNISYMPISEGFAIAFIIFSIIMFLTIKKSIEAYYKQKLLIQDLNETKKELEEKKKEVEELEAENLNFSKKSHSLAHKQKSLEFKINKLLMNSENAKELGLESDLKNLSKELYENSKLPQLEKTGITEIDDMLCVMQEECRMNGIDFSLQLKGNIYQMTNNFVTKEELSILLADHIKDAIIAINHTDTINKTIMVRLGKIDENFGLYIYDSGVEFPKEVLESLGKKPITTYHNEGGTGMGFMNTFDTLNKHNASLIIESIGKPSNDNYTKVIKIIFDGKNDRIYK